MIYESNNGWECTEHWEKNLLSMEHIAHENWMFRKNELIDTELKDYLLWLIVLETDCYTIEGFHEL